MSDAGTILAALTAAIESAVAGITVSEAAINFSKLRAEDLPYCQLLLSDYGVEELDYVQEERTWTFVGIVAQEGGTRETMQVKADAIRDAILADTTLGGIVDRTLVAPIVPYSHEDSAQVRAELTIAAKVVPL